MSKYTYSNDEWLNDIGKFSNLSHISKFEKGEVDRKGDAILGIEELFDLKKNDRIVDMNGDKKAINNALKQIEDGGMLVDKLMEMRSKYDDEISSVKEFDIGSVSIKEYLQFILNKKDVVTRDSFPVKNKKFLDNTKITDKIIKFVKDGKDTDFKKYLENNDVENCFKKGLNSVLGWGCTDIAKFPMGSANDFVNVAIAVYKQNPGGLTVEQDLGFLLDIFSLNYPDGREGLKAYLERGMRDVLAELSKRDDNYKIRLFKDGIDKNVSVFSKSDLNEKKFNDAIADALNKNNSRHSKEFLVVFLYWLFEEVQLIYTEFYKVMEKSGNLNSFKLGLLKETIKNIEKSWKSGLVKWFKLTGKIEYGGIIKGTKTTAKINPLDKEWVWRIFGEEDGIEAEDKFTIFKYPIKLVDLGKSVKDLSQIVGGACVDVKSGKDIRIGGIIPDEKMGKTTLEILKKYLSQDIIVKEFDLKRINRILIKMKSKLHIKFLINIKNKIRKAYLLIADEADKEIKGLRANAIIQDLLNGYQNLKNEELNKVVAIYKLLELMRGNNVNMEALDKLKSEKEGLLIKLSQAQMKAVAYREIALSLYRDMILEMQSKYNLKEKKKEVSILNGEIDKEALPMRFFTQMSESFQQMDKDYTDKIKEVAVSRSGIGSDMIIGALNSDKKYHPNFWEKIFSANVVEPVPNVIVNLDNDSDENKNGGDEVITVDINKNKSGNNKNNTNKSGNKNNKSDNVGLIEITNKNLTGIDVEVVKQEFWLKVRDSLDGKSIYIPFVRTRTILPDQHGIFDILEALIRGRITTDLFIYGSQMTDSVISKAIVPRGRILVCGTKDNKDRPTRWRLFLKEEIDLFVRSSERDMRLHFYKTFIDETVYNKRANMYWGDESETREKILKYCRRLGSYMECSLIVSREEIGKKINS